MQAEASDCLSKGGSCYFITLTYEDSQLPCTEYGEPTLYPKHLCDFVRALRSHFRNTRDITGVRYFGAGEYGDKFDRPHYHLCLFIPFLITAAELRPIVVKFWSFGLVLGVYPFSAKLSEYIAKYSTKRIGEVCDNGKVSPFARMSLKPAIGSAWIDKHSDFYRKNRLTVVYDSSGTPFSLPRYYRDRVFTLDLYDEYLADMQNRADVIFKAKCTFNGGYSWIREDRLAKQRFEDIFWEKLKLSKQGIK